MTREPSLAPLTAEQKSQICGVLAIGCDRRTAADYVGCWLADIRQAMQEDTNFLADVCRMEAQVEVRHMQNIQKMATGEKRDWRASVWWLERRSPERFGRRTAGTVTPRQLKAFISILADCLHSDVHSEEDRNRIGLRLQAISDSVDQMLQDAQASFSECLDDDNADDAAPGDSTATMVAKLLDYNGAF